MPCGCFVDDVSSLPLLSLSLCMSVPPLLWVFLLQRVWATTMAIPLFLLHSGQAASSTDVTMLPTLSSSSGVPCWLPGGPKLARTSTHYSPLTETTAGRVLDLSDLVIRNVFLLFLSLVECSFRNLSRMPCDNVSDEFLVTIDIIEWVYESFLFPTEQLRSICMQLNI